MFMHFWIMCANMCEIQRYKIKKLYYYKKYLIMNTRDTKIYKYIKVKERKRLFKAKYSL